MAREPRAVLLLLALAVAGHAARLVLGGGASPPGGLLVSAPDADTAALDLQRARAERLGRPLAQGEVIDVNSASAEELARLPRVGMSLAKRLVGDRSSRGPFRGLRDLDRVPGVGPALLTRLADRVRFGPGSGTSLAPESRAIPGTYRAMGRAVGEPSDPLPTVVNLNQATVEELESLPGIGPVRARAILAFRRENGGFASVSDLVRVPGIGRSLAMRLMDRVTVR